MPMQYRPAGAGASSWQAGGGEVRGDTVKKMERSLSPEWGDRERSEADARRAVSGLGLATTAIKEDQNSGEAQEDQGDDAPAAGDVEHEQAGDGHQDCGDRR